MPIFLLTPISWFYFYKKYKSLTILLIFLTLIMIIYVGIGGGWNFNPHWGHRHLIPIIPMAIIPIGALISNFSNTLRLKLSVIIFSIIGFFVNLLGNLVWVQYAYAYGWGPEEIWKVPVKLRPGVFTWNPYQSPIIQSIKVLANDWTASLDPDPIALNYFKIGLNGCSYDIYLFCEFGIEIIILLSVLISITGLAILYILKNKKKIEKDAQDFLSTNSKQN